MPALALDLLTQVIFELEGQAGLAAAEPFGHLLQVVAAHGARGQLAQQGHQPLHRLLELVRTGQILILEHLLDLPVEPGGGRIEQGAVFARPVLLEELIGVLTGGQLQHPQLQLALEGQLLHLADGPLGGPDAGPVGIEIEDQPLALAAPAELGDLLAAQGRPQGGHRIGDPGRMQGNHIEIALHHHGPVVAADGIGGPIEPEEVLALLEHLRFWGIEVLGLATIEAAAAKADDAALAIADRHHHPVAEAVVEATAVGGLARAVLVTAALLTMALAGHHQARRLEQLRRQPLHLAQVVEQPIPALRGVAQAEALNRDLTEAPAVLEIGQGRGPLARAQLAAEPAGRQGQGTMELLPAGELLAQPLLLGTIEGFNRQLVFTGQLQDHIGEAEPLQFHQELDRITAGTAGEAVVELLGGRHRHRRRFVVVEGADPDELPPLLLEHHVLTHHINNVGPFFDRLDRAGMEAREGHGQRGRTGER